MAEAQPPSDYRTASSANGFGNRIGWGKKPALLLIDVCKGYWTAGSPLDTSSNPASAASLDVMKRLLAAARESEVPVIWTTIRYRRDMKDAGLFFAKAKQLSIWSEGDTSGLSDWVDGLVPDEVAGETVLVKRHASAFFGTELASMLVGMGVDTLVIGGVSTSGCVRATTLDALSYNFRPMVVESACGDRSREIHQANVHDMDAKMADIVAEEEAVEHLRAGWG